MSDTRNDAERPKEKPPLTEAQRAKQAVEQEKLDSLREINRKFYWKAQQDNVEFELKRNGELVKVNSPQGGLAMISMGNSALPNPLEMKEEGVYELTTKYTNDQGKKFTTKVVMNIDKDHNISLPGRDHAGNRYGMKHNWAGDWGAVFQAYSVGLGVHQVNLRFPNATKPSDVNLQEAWEIVKQANAAGVAVYIDKDPNLMMRLNNPDPKSPMEIRLCEKIRQGIAESQQKVANNKVWSAEIQEATRSTYTSGLAKRGDALDEAVKALKEATERDPAKVKAIENATTHVTAMLDAMKADFAKSQPNTTASSEYKHAAEKMATTLNRLKDELSAAGLQASPDDLKKLRDGVDKLETQFREISGKAAVNAKPAEDRANDKIADLKEKMRVVDEKLEVLKVSAASAAPPAPAEQVKQMEEFTTSMKKAVESVREIGGEMKKDDAGVHLLKMATEVDVAVKKAETVLAEMTNIHPDKADSVSQMQNEMKMVSRDLQSHLEPLNAIDKQMENIRNLPTVEEKQVEIIEAMQKMQQEATHFLSVTKTATDVDTLDAVDRSMQILEKRFAAIGELVTTIQRNGSDADKGAMKEPNKLGLNVRDEMDQQKNEAEKKRENLVAPSIAGKHTK